MTGDEDRPIRVLLVDDQMLVRSGFRMILTSEPGIEVVGEASDGLEGVDAEAELCPDVVVMDIRMPRLDGVEATRRIVDRAASTARVLVVTTFDLDADVHAALRAGASGFLLKDAPPEDLVRAVRVVACGESLLSPSVTRRLIEQVASDAPIRATPPTVPELDELTDREREVLVELGHGRSNAEIAEALFVSETTVKTHVGRILTKLDLRDRVQAVVFAYEHGIVTPGSEP